MYCEFLDNIKILGVPLKFLRIKIILERSTVLVGAIVIEIGNKLIRL